jgi:prevent-host-death family protein
MDKTIQAVEANRQFSRILRDVRAGDHFIITAHGRPVAEISPVKPQDASRMAARRALEERLNAQPAVDIGHWTRDELYN